MLFSKKVNDESNSRKFRENLLGGTAIVAVVAVGMTVGVPQFAAPASAADIQVDNTDGADGGAFGNIDDIVNTVDDATDFLFAEIDADAGNADEIIRNIDNFNFDGAISVSDTNNIAANALNITGFVDITAGKTLTLVLGNQKVDSSGIDTTKNTTVAVTGNIGGTNGTTVGGALVISGANDLTGDFDAVFTAAGNVLASALTVNGGTGATDEGASATVTLGNASTDTINIATITANGGTSAADLGGVTQITVTGTLSDATGGIDINGGTGGTGKAGGGATV